MNAPVYLDTQNKIEYLFFGFPIDLSEEDKRSIVAKHGKPRRVPLGKKEFKNGAFSFSITAPEVWETKIIYYKGPLPEDILSYDLGCRMLATD
jgi:hypothetical protein